MFCIILTVAVAAQDYTRCNSDIVKYNDAALKICQKLDVTVVDLHNLVKSVESPIQSLYRDHVHFQASVSKKLANKVFETIQQDILADRVEQSKSQPAGLVDRPDVIVINAGLHDIRRRSNIPQACINLAERSRVFQIDLVPTIGWFGGIQAKCERRHQCN